MTIQDLEYIQHLEAELKSYKAEICVVQRALESARQELETIKQERDAAVRDIPRACGFCKWYEITNNGCTPDHDCKNPNECLNISGINTGWQWRGVCPENTEARNNG